jgi:hypothetical protein
MPDSKSLNAEQLLEQLRRAREASECAEEAVQTLEDDSPLPLPDDDSE